MAEEAKTTFAKSLTKYFYGTGSQATLSSDVRIPILDKTGNAVGSNTLSNIAKNVQTVTPTIDADYFNRPEVQAAFDNIFIAVTRISDNFPLYLRPYFWASSSSRYYNTSSYHTAGVAIVEDSHGIVVAKDEFDGTKQWGPTGTLVGTAISNRLQATKDLTGQTRTAAIVANENYSSTDYAAAWCNAYSQTGETEAYSNKGENADSTAYNLRQAGKWWLPSGGELWLIYRNFQKINQVLTLIESKQSGTTVQLKENWYWSSTETSANRAWDLLFHDGSFTTSTKASTYRVRAVSALY